MYIPQINYSNNNYNLRPALKKTEPVFTGFRIEAASEKGVRNMEFCLRVLGNKFIDLFENKKTKKITKIISEIKPEANEKYLLQLNTISRFYATGKDIEINLEDKILEKIAKNGKSTIFIMNHSNQSQDPSMLAVLNTLLAEAYKISGKGNNFPLPKIILNQDILKSMNSTRRKAFEAFGAIGIDASIKGGDKTFNARVFFPLIKDFIKDKCNIFIFPEGKLAIRKDLPLEQRFQTGVAEMINKILGIKKEVTVVPVGFAYGKGGLKNLTGIHIGEPLIFTRKGENTTTTAGTILKSSFANNDFLHFFDKHKEQNNVIITENGIPVRSENITEFIKSILVENLNICTKEAITRISHNPEREKVLLV